jgi:hypothetical protein
MKKLVKMALVFLAASLMFTSLAHANNNEPPVVIDGVSETVLLVGL